MTAQYTFRVGSDDPIRGMPVSAWLACAQAIDKAGLDSGALFDAQALVLVEGGLGIDASSSARCAALPTEHGLAVLMPAGTQASVEREGGRALRLLAALDGSFECAGGPNTIPFREPQGDQGLDPAAAEWLRSGERGRSAEELCRLFFGAPQVAGFPDDHPHPMDPSDLRRCALFLSATSTHGRIQEAASLSPQWAALVERWDELTSLLAQEAPSGSCPRCYEAMNQAIERAQAPAPRGPRP